MEFVKIAKLKDFEYTRVKSFRLLGRYVGVFKEHEGSFYAIQVGCMHENADLTQGKIRGDTVVCPWHGWKYNLRTGKCLWGCEGRLKSHGLKVEGEDIFITLRPSKDPASNQQEEYDHLNLDDEVS